MNLFLLQDCGNRLTFSRMLRFTLFLALTFFVSSLAQAESSESWGEWKQARFLYDSQSYQESLAEFLKHPQYSGNFYNNLGTNYFRLNEVGQALAFMEKASRLEPHDPDIKHNLAVIRSVVSQKIGEDQLDPASTWTELASEGISTNEVRVLLGLTGLILSLIWIRAFRNTLSLRRTFLNRPSLAGSVVFLVVFMIFGIQHWSSASPAICIRDGAIWSGPGTHFMQLGNLREGTKIRLLEGSSPGWRQIRFGSDAVGWIPSERLEEL